MALGVQKRQIFLECRGNIARFRWISSNCAKTRLYLFSRHPTPQMPVLTLCLHPVHWGPKTLESHCRGNITRFQWISSISKTILEYCRNFAHVWVDNLWEINLYVNTSIIQLTLGVTRIHEVLVKYCELQPLIHLPLHKMGDISQTTFLMHFHEWKVVYHSNFNEVCY